LRFRVRFANRACRTRPIRIPQFKGVIIALQFHNEAEQGRPER
jgi:hypothetical protein